MDKPDNIFTMQKIIWPWQTPRWQEIKEKFIDAQIISVVDMDARIVSMYKGAVRPKLINDLFTQYYTDPTYAEGRVSSEYFIQTLLPFMQSLIGNAPKLFSGVTPVMTNPSIISFTRPQVATIIVCIWFGLFNYNYISKGQCTLENMPEPTFINAFLGNNMFFLQCMMRYFSFVYSNMKSKTEEVRDMFEAGNIIVKRSQASSVDWLNSAVPIEHIAIGEGLSDESPSKMFTAYSSEFIGGLRLFENPVSQEGIILLTRPECMIALLISPMLANDTVTVLGSEKLSQQVGYGSGTRYAGEFHDITPRGYSADDTEVMIKSACVFMDASGHNSTTSQFVDDFQRDLNKAYCGFNSLKFKSLEQIATGNWSYRFSGNNMQVKFIQQLLAATQSNKQLVYYPFGKEFEDRLVVFIDWILTNQLTVGDLFNIYINVIDDLVNTSSRLHDLDLFTAIMDFV